MNLSFAPEAIEMWPLDRLRPYAANAKTHGEEQVAKIAASMAEFGWTVPVLVSGDGEVIAGHGRILAATQLGLTEAPVGPQGRICTGCSHQGGRRLQPRGTGGRSHPCRCHRRRPQDQAWCKAVDCGGCQTYRFLRLTRPTDEDRAAGALPPAGYVHLSEAADAEWMKQLVAEQLVTVKTKRGFQKLEWQKLRERNEALDCRVYARAAAWIAGADRWSEAMWRDLERQVAAVEGVDEEHRF
jgi:hypothetical protein